MTWTLIALVIIAGFGGPTQVAVPGFSSREACVAASQTYLAQLNEQSAQTRVVFRSACVSSGDVK